MNKLPFSQRDSQPAMYVWWQQFFGQSLDETSQGEDAPPLKPHTKRNDHDWIMLHIPGWWLTHPSEKYKFVSWDDDIPNIWKNKIHVPNHQPDTVDSIHPR